MDSEKNKDYFKMIASLEQASAGMRSVAGLVSSYFNALLESGFKREEAFELSREYQTCIFKSAFGLHEKGEENE